MASTKSSTYSADIAILGSGFAGSLLALIVKKIGLKPILLDKAVHPRFAIGESSTPTGNMILRDLSEKYTLPQLTPLCTYASWRDTYPNLINGRKRGFSYFQHERGTLFKPDALHNNELLVAASADNERCDTHWLRADIDHFLVKEAQTVGIPVLEGAQVTTIAQHSERVEPDAWQIEALIKGRRCTIKSAFVVDATGSAGLLARRLGLSDLTDTLRTNSHALFSHFVQVPTWHKLSIQAGGRIEDHPYCCDDAAVHHCIQQGWLWMLRFVDGRVSAGFALDGSAYNANYSVTLEQAWNGLLATYPSLQQVFQDATLAETPGKLYRTGRLQRLWGQAAGSNWALMPHTAGFIDPLHSTGIAHSMSSIEQLAVLFEHQWQSDTLASSLKAYSDRVIREIKLIDTLVAGCYPCFGQFEILNTYLMLYFAAAITYEERRIDARNCGLPFSQEFLCADEAPLVHIIETTYQKLLKLLASNASQQDIEAFRNETRQHIEPYNTAGLFNPRINNMYEYTAAEF